jgi:hypothetical protein
MNRNIAEIDEKNGRDKKNEIKYKEKGRNDGGEG